MFSKNCGGGEGGGGGRGDVILRGSMYPITRCLVYFRVLGIIVCTGFE